MNPEMPWLLSWRADPRAKRLADQHYNRQSPDSAQFVPPGGCCVLRTIANTAVWVTSTPDAEFTKHEWAGRWVNTLFRREDGAPLASDLITAAVAASRFVLGEPPPEGIVTFVDTEKVRPKRDPGRCYRRAGWKVLGYTKGGLLALGQERSEMPIPDAPLWCNSRSDRMSFTRPLSAARPRLELVPIDLTEGKAFVAQVHRHHPPPQGGKWVIGCADAEGIVGVAIFGRTVARNASDTWTGEVIRNAVMEGERGRHACSKLYAACWRAARAMGYRKVITYTLPSESGASLRAAGFKIIGTTKGGSWNREARPRVDKHPTQGKLIWGRVA